MSFKLKSPYVDNTVPVFKVPMERGVYGKANNDISSNSGFNIHVNQNINDTPTYLKVVEHENGHIDQMARGDMDYDDKYVYWKGQKIPRANMPEGAHDLPWEKEIYDKSPVNMKLRNGSGNHPAFANLSERGLIKPHAQMASPLNKKPKEYKKGGDLFSTTSYKPLQLGGGETSEVTQKREWSTMYKGEPQSKVTLKEGEKIDPSQVSGYDIGAPTIDVKTTDVSDKPIKRDFQSKTTGVYRKKAMDVDGERVEFANPVVEVKTTTGAQPGTSKKVEITKYRKDGTAKKTKTYEGEKFKKGVTKGERLTAGKYKKRSGEKKKRFSKAKVGGHSGLSPQARAQVERDFNIKSNRLEDVSIKKS